jgi:hypothetical protein
MEQLWKNINDFKKYRLRTGEVKSGLEWKQMGYKWPQLLEEVA